MTRGGRSLRGAGAVLALFATFVPGCGPTDASPAAPGAASGTAPGTAAGPTAARPGGAPAPALLLVTLDTTRADRLGCYGDHQAATPTLDGLAAAGLRFDQARAPAPITLPSHASMLTGAWPLQHGLRDNADRRAGSRALLVPEVLAERGFATAARVGSFVLDAGFGLSQGFDSYAGPPPGDAAAAPTVVERPADAVVDDALAWLATVPRERPLFLWVHFYDPHHPWQAPERLVQRLGDGYAAEIAFCDEQLARLLDGFRRAGRDGNLALVVAGDHGESLGEHGETTHGLLLRDSTLRVPLLVVAPALAGEAGRVIDAPVSLVDVAPTCLDLLGLPRELLPEAAGVSLLASAGLSPAPDGTPLGDERPLLIESVLPWSWHRWRPLAGVVWHGYKLVEGGRARLYRPAEDPGERHDLAAEEPQIVASLREAAAATAAALASDWSEARPLGAGEREGLAALGYLGSASAPSGAGLVDGRYTAFAIDGLSRLPGPLDRLGDIPLIDTAVDLLRSARILLGSDPAPPGLDLGALPPDERRRRATEALRDARDKLSFVLSANPRDPLALANLGLVLMAEGDHAAALAAFEQHAAEDPASPLTAYNLGLCREALGQLDAARGDVLRALALQPRLRPAALWLAKDARDRDLPGVEAWCLQAVLAGGDTLPDTLLAELDAARTRAEARGRTVRPPEGLALAAAGMGLPPAVDPTTTTPAARDPVR